MRFSLSVETKKVKRFLTFVEQKKRKEERRKGSKKTGREMIF